MSSYLTLSQNKKTLVCDCHLDLVVNYKWQYNRVRNDGGYAVRTDRSNSTQSSVWLHRVINNTPENMQTDHINGDKLDNRCTNLRSVTARQNSYNRPLRRDNKTGAKGIYERFGKWRAMIRVDGRLKHIGVFSSKAEATNAYNEMALLVQSEYIRTN